MWQYRKGGAVNTQWISGKLWKEINKKKASWESRREKRRKRRCWGLCCSLTFIHWSEQFCCSGKSLVSEESWEEKSVSRSSGHHWQDYKDYFYSMSQDHNKYRNGVAREQTTNTATAFLGLDLTRAFWNPVSAFKTLHKLIWSGGLSFPLTGLSASLKKGQHCDFIAALPSSKQL